MKKLGISGWVILCLTSIMIAVYMLSPVARAQLIFFADDGEHSTILPVSVGGKVAIGFRHSLYHVEQTEYYAVQDRSFLLESVYFGSFDALNYYDPTGEWPRQPKGAGYEIFPSSKLEEVNFAIARSTPVWLLVADEPPIFLTNIPVDFTRFSLRVIRRPRVQLLLGDLRP
ncbi:MAG: DUF1850 domain-containing protein [Rhodospirillales bacterium]|nr:DUF1850 domain-containing protein [Rhodospirillales bacterium]